MTQPIQSHHIPRTIETLVKQAKVGILTTCSMDALPHPAIIFYCYYPIEDTLYFFTSRTTRTFRYLCQNPNVSVCIDQRDLRNPMRNFGVMLRGLAKHIKNEEEINRVLKDLLNKKYRSLPKDSQKLKKNYWWLVPPDRRCFRLEITTMVWWRGPYFRKIRIRPQKI
ncbi:MAG: pyridoxamine 5'-phosphate oxidase family protein [Candidatus Heimdallarchaeota archaeon]